MSQFFTSGGQSIGVSASTSVLPMNTQDWSPLGWTDWISLQSKGLSRVFSNTTGQKHRFFLALSFIVLLSHPYMTIGKTIALTRWAFVGKVMSLLLVPTSYLFYTRSCIYVSATFLTRPTLSFPCCIHMSILCVCVSILALQISSSVPFSRFHIYALILTCF